MADTRLERATKEFIGAVRERAADTPPCGRIQYLTPEEEDFLAEVYLLLRIKVNRTLDRMYIGCNF